MEYNYQNLSSFQPVVKGPLYKLPISNKIDFYPPQRKAIVPKKSILPSTIKTVIPKDSQKNKKYDISVLANIRKPKRFLSAYNIFFKQERKKILAQILTNDEKGNDDQSHDCNNKRNILGSQPKRGRPRGPNYKKKVPHRKIGFEDLTKIISLRWHSAKHEFKLKYEALVDQDKKRYKEEMVEYRKKLKNALLKETKGKSTHENASSSELKCFDGNNNTSSQHNDVSYTFSRFETYKEEHQYKDEVKQFHGKDQITSSIDNHSFPSHNYQNSYSSHNSRYLENDYDKMIKYEIQNEPRIESAATFHFQQTENPYSNHFSKPVTKVHDDSFEYNKQNYLQANRQNRLPVNHDRIVPNSRLRSHATSCSHYNVNPSKKSFCYINEVVKQNDFHSNQRNSYFVNNRLDAKFNEAKKLNPHNFIRSVEHQRAGRLTPLPYQK